MKPDVNREHVNKGIQGGEPDAERDADRDTASGLSDGAAVPVPQ